MNPIDRVLDALRGRGEVKRKGRDWSCLCPAHEDNDPSLDVGTGDDGRVVMICRSAGCKPDQIVQALGLTMQDLFRKDETHHQNGHQKHASAPSRDWLRKAKRCAAALTPALKKELAGVIHLPVESINALDLVGWNESNSANWRGWTFPERNESGGIVGIMVRPRVGKKKAMPGGERGLIIPRSWHETPGPAFLVEGASDVLAGTQCGLCVIGRPMAQPIEGVVKDLAELLKNTNREVVVVGENDGPKDDGKWPGRDGAIETARALTKQLGRPVRYSLPPEGVKDLRAWVTDLADGSAQENPWPSVGREVGEGLIKRAVSATPTRFKFEDVGEFLSGDYQPQWLVERCLVRGEPGVIAGPMKGLKTSVSIDLAISLAAGRPFLGKFPVRRRVRTALISGESGKQTIKETILRVLSSKGISTADVEGWLKLEFSIPTLTDPASMVDLANHIQRIEADVAIGDPTYLMMGAGVDQKNIFEVGDSLKEINKYLNTRRPDITFFLVHHSNKTLSAGSPMELEHLSYTGLGQYARQWMLLNRRESYQDDGRHKLWLRIGGSHGGGGLWGLDVEEGQIDENFQGRKWQLKVETIDGVKAEVATDKALEKREAKRLEKESDDTAVLNAIDAEVSRGQGGATKGRIREITGLSHDRATDSVNRLLACGAIVKTSFQQQFGKGAKKQVDGFRSPPD